MKPYRNYTSPEGEPYYPLMVCRRCGQPYIEGFSDEGKLHNNHQETFASSRTNRGVYRLGEMAGEMIHGQREDTPSTLLPILNEPPMTWPFAQPFFRH
ncbi:MAG: hypothetical protein U9P10_14230 [Thermodesulfobacteriota bacterium]|nr:hypothetical protein [Thermodesulfobacteriota bacterium]